MGNQIDRQNGSPTTQWQLGYKPFKSPNHRLASLMGVLVFSISLLLTGTMYGEIFAALFRSPWIGDVIIWAVAATLGGLAKIFIGKILDRFRPAGKLWPSQENYG